MSPEAKRPPHWEEKTAQVISAKQMRKGVGWLAVLLPVLTGVGYCVFGAQRGGFLDSISESYYTLMRDVFVGTLCMEAFFLVAYRGYNAFEDRLFNVLGGLCVVIAVFSMNSKEGAPGGDPDPMPGCYHAIQVTPTCVLLLNNRVAMSHYELFGWVHIGAAAVLFVALGYVSYCLFTRTEPGATPTPQKLRRDGILSSVWARDLDSVLRRIPSSRWRRYSRAGRSSSSRRPSVSWHSACRGWSREMASTGSPTGPSRQPPSPESSCVFRGRHRGEQSPSLRPPRSAGELRGGTERSGGAGGATWYG